MTRMQRIMLAASFAFAGHAMAQSAPADAPATQPAVRTEVTDRAHRLLDRIEAAAKTLKTLTATLRWDRLNDLTGDEQRRFGKLHYLAGPPAKFAASFDRLLFQNADGQWRSEAMDNRYLFDGKWLVERVVEKTGNGKVQKRFTKRQLVADDAPPEASDPLAMGAGPFAVPLAASKQRILDRFNAVIIDDLTDEDFDEFTIKHAADTTRLRLIPRVAAGSEFTAIDIWYDNQTMLPKLVYTVDKSKSASWVHLIDTKVNEPIDEATIDSTTPTEKGWDVQIIPLEPTEPPQPDEGNAEAEPDTAPDAD